MRLPITLQAPRRYKAMVPIFEFDFMRRAFLVGLLLAIIIPCIGMIVVLKRLSMLGDALSHTSLAFFLHKQADPSTTK